MLISHAALRLLSRRAAARPGKLRRAALVAIMPRLLRRHGLKDLLRLLDASSPPAAGADARELVEALRRVPATCLTRALAGFAALRAAGEPVRLVIGVRATSGTPEAHAWLEQDGAPLGEPADPGRGFTRAFSHPPAEPAPGGPMAASSPPPDAILTELRDGTGVLLDLRSKFYFTLNRTGVAVWKLLAAGEPASARALAERIVRDFDAPPLEVVEADVAALLAELAAEGVVAEVRG